MPATQNHWDFCSGATNPSGDRQDWISGDSDSQEIFSIAFVTARSMECRDDETGIIGDIKVLYWAGDVVKLFVIIVVFSALTYVEYFSSSFAK